MSNNGQEYKVVKKVMDSDIITSFYLEPACGVLPEFIPGQYLTFNIPVGKDGALERREYSLSWWDEKTARVTIKREPRPAGKPDVPAGAVSNYFHDNVHVGDQVFAFEPRGQFLLDRDSERPVVLLSGGVGVTPMLAIAHELVAETDRPLWFIHACENGRVHALGDEVKVLQSKSPHLKTHICYRVPDAEDKEGENFDSVGFVSADTLKSLLPLDDYEFYLCGPGPFMQAMYDLLSQLGVAEKRINYEFFGPATILKPSVENTENDEQTVVKSKSSQSVSEGQPTIRFEQSDMDVVWDPEFENLLEFAEEQGIFPNFSCRAGSCDSCKVGLNSGDVDYHIEPFEKPGEGNVLLCCSYPTSDVSLDI